MYRLTDARKPQIAEINLQQYTLSSLIAHSVKNKVLEGI